MDIDKLYIITPVMNPLQFRSRNELYKKFEAHVKNSGANLLTVECAFGDRPWEFTQPNDPWDLQLRSYDELWQKECMLNAGIARLPPDWQYVVWADCDISFQRPDWIKATWDALQHHMVVQPWAQCIDMGPKFEIIQTHKSFCSQWWKNDFRYPDKDCYGYGGFYHSGYCVAARREAIEALGGILDFPILGSADHHFMLALIGKVDKSCPLPRTSNYYKKLKIYEERALRYLKKDIGFVDGIILHGFHGSKKKRYYQSRWSILKDNDFDPETDLRRDPHGLWMLNVDSERQIRLRDGIRAYFKSRDEDGTEI